MDDKVASLPLSDGDTTRFYGGRPLSFAAMAVYFTDGDDAYDHHLNLQMRPYLVFSPQPAG